MDGSDAAFLLYSAELSALSGRAGGILYVEDFDRDPVSEGRETEPDLTDRCSPTVSFTQADVQAAREEGRLAGQQATFFDAQLLQSELQAAATQSLADVLGAAQDSLIRQVRQSADDGMRLIFAVLKAAIPAVMERYATEESEAIVQALARAIALEPELRVRAHPKIADGLRETVVGLLPPETGVLSVVADPSLAPGDVHVAWRSGHAIRDTERIWTTIGEAFTSLNLPSIKEICHGCGH